MNRYGEMALEHWQRWLPERFAEIADPEAFFESLGEEADQEIQDRAEAITQGLDLAQDYLTRAGQLREAQLSAESAVLREMILVEPETLQDPAAEAAAWVAEAKALVEPSAQPDRSQDS